MQIRSTKWKYSTLFFSRQKEDNFPSSGIVNRSKQTPVRKEVNENLKVYKKTQEADFQGTKYVLT
jgi:hypothetical protein